MKHIIAKILNRIAGPHTDLNPAADHPVHWSRRVVVDLSRLDQHGHAR